MKTLFRKIKTIFVISSIIFVVCAGVYYYADRSIPAVEYTREEPMTRLEKAKKLIDELTEERLNDASFVAETDRLIKELQESRRRQARLDALTIVQTKIESEANEIGKAQKK